MSRDFFDDGLLPREQHLVGPAGGACESPLNSLNGFTSESSPGADIFGAFVAISNAALLKATSD